MKPITAEWVAKAEGDFATLERESRVRKDPNYDGICFHAQQCAEKYLKARLTEAEVRFTRIHDLTALLDLALPIEPLWEEFREDLAYLSDFGVAFRYPGESADRESAIIARKRCRIFRYAARRALGANTAHGANGADGGICP
jgi:HEPN domain-containing protein